MEIRKKLTREYHKGTVDKNGKITPFLINIT